MIIESLLDNDLYKFTMMQAVLHHFPGAIVRYRFKCRTPGIDLVPHIDRISSEIDHLCSLQFNEYELKYLSEIPFIKPDFIEFLRMFKLNRKFVHIGQENGEFALWIGGPWLHTILFEVPILSIVSEAYSTSQSTGDLEMARKLLNRKIETIQGIEQFRFADFGTRRRYAKSWHYELLKLLRGGVGFKLVGTSNVLFAKKLHLTPIGTMAHEWIMAGQAMVRLADSQRFMLQKWADEYRGSLGIALSDTVGIDAFLKDFDLYFAKLFDGCRHDSGDPYKWGMQLVKHYNDLGIDSSTKSAVFSDGLTFEKAKEINEHFNGTLKTSFGIGTHLTNDVGVKAPQIVIKMVECAPDSITDSVPVAKISDSPGKQMCEDESYLKYLESVFK